MKKLRIISIFFIAIILASITINPVSQVFATNDFYSSNDILFYDPEDTTDTNLNCTPTGSVASKVWNYFIGKGLTKEQTAGIMGNMFRESHISPTTWESTTADMFSVDYKGGWGFFGWSGTNRYDITTTTKNGQTTTVESGILGVIKTTRPEFLKYVDLYYNAWGSEIDVAKGVLLDGNGELEEKNIPKSDLDNLVLFELDYMWDEFEFSSFLGYDQLKATTTVREAAIVFHKTYERSRDKEEIIQQRADWAEIIYNTLKDRPTGNFNSGDCPSGNSFIDTIKKYVWNTYRGNYDKEGGIAVIPTDDYRNAVLTAKTAGRYTGDNCSELGVGGGIDCGGFVTTIIHDSGLDTGYNHDALVSNGAGTTAVQMKWMNENWLKLGDNNTIKTNELLPGDVAIENYKTVDEKTIGHVIIYIGEIDGFQSKTGYLTASASQCHRAPMVTNYELASTVANDSHYVWYRKN